MTKQIVAIYVETEIDPSQLLDLALEFGKHVTDMTCEPCTVDEDKTYVTDADEAD